jgi:hypothetical protein
MDMKSAVTQWRRSVSEAFSQEWILPSWRFHPIKSSVAQGHDFQRSLITYEHSIADRYRKGFGLRP